MVGSRAANQVAQVYLQAIHPMSVLYMKRAHEKGHEGAVSILQIQE
jgi:hypothetical protein